jgi:hypothetical protein
MLPAQDFGAVEMACVEARRLIVDYMEGDLDFSTFARVVYHVENCAHCEAIFSGVRNVVELLGSFGEFALKEDLSSLYPLLPSPPDAGSSRDDFDS